MLKKYLTPALLCEVLLTACVPGPDLIAPPVAGTVTDARTHLPLSDARISVLYPSRDPSAPVLSSGVSDAQGRFNLAARYKLGLVFIYGDPSVAQINVRISKPGYRTFVADEDFVAHVALQRGIHLDAALTPNSKAP